VGRLRIASIGLLILLAAGAVGEGRAPSILVLKKSWVNKYKNRLSIDAKVTITALNSGTSEDGDTHGGSFKNAVGLPMVVEILNGHAAAQKTARDALKPVSGATNEKEVYGAWRLWFEHPPSGGVQCQSFGKTVPAICQNQTLDGADSNPHHSFEIHPVFSVDGHAVGRPSLRLTPDNQQVKTAESAEAEYTGANKKLNIVRSTTAVTLSSIKVTHNYVRMRIRLTKARTETRRARDDTVDGGWVKGHVLETGGDHLVLMPDVRFFYLRDSDPGDALDAAAVGREFIILAMPRINLDEVMKATTNPIPLPFEFIVVALIETL
jgi:hypothetical protein